MFVRIKSSSFYPLPVSGQSLSGQREVAHRSYPGGHTLPPKTLPENKTDSSLSARFLPHWRSALLAGRALVLV